MKVRFGFITNSSSSSFIISTTKEPPENIADFITKITKDNYVEKLNNEYCFEYDCHVSAEDYKSIGFTDEQIFAINFMQKFGAHSYKVLMDALYGNESVYFSCIDNDVYYNFNDVYYHLDELYTFIHGSKILLEEQE